MAKLLNTRLYSNEKVRKFIVKKKCLKKVKNL